MKCSKCNMEMVYRDRVKRLTKSEGGAREFIFVKRFKCPVCGSIRRDLPSNLKRFKQYTNAVREYAIENTLTDVLNRYEDYPCEMTIQRWKKCTDFVLKDEKD